MFATLGGCTGKQSGLTDSDRSAAFDQLAHSVVAQRGVPGLAIAAVRDGKPFRTLSLGYSDLNTHSLVSSSTPFQLASTTKIFASTAVLLLVVNGQVNLDDPIGNYLDKLPASWRAVTIRQLLSHTSGLPDITRSTGELDLVADDWDSALAVIADEPFQFQPGHGWAYTQTNYVLLQRLIEKVSGKSFEAYLEERLFRPLGMLNSFFPTSERRCAANYERNGSGKVVTRDLSFPPYVHAAGGLCSSLGDLIRWSSALDSGKLIPRSLEQQAWTPAKLADGSNAKVDGSVSYGLGWAVDTTPGHRWAGHSGGNSTAFRRYLDDGITVIVLHNGASDPDAIASSVARLMLEESASGSAQSDLWDAATSGDLTAAQTALSAGADAKALDTRSSRNGRYALNWAAIDNHPDMIRLLLAHGAAIDAQNSTGFTALHHAAESGAAAAAQALLAAGANPAIRNANGETASDVARRKGHMDIANLIDGARRKTG